MQNREELIQEREDKFANFMDKLKDKANQKLPEQLVKELDSLHDLVLKVDMNQDLDSRRADKRVKGFYGAVLRLLEAKHIKMVIFSFIAGMILTLIPTLLYISSLSKDNTPEYQFIPNALVKKKGSQDFDLIRTEEELKKAKTAHLSNKEKLKIGSTIGLNPQEGLYVALSNKGATFQDIKPSVTDVVSNEYVFTPDVRKTRLPRLMDYITTEEQIAMIKTIPHLGSAKVLSLGATLAEDDQGGFYIIPKEKIDKEYTIIPLDQLFKK